MKTPVRVAVTGAAGQIGYSLLFRIASGALLGPDQPVILQLLEITPALDALKGVAMELEDCAFPLLAGIVQTDDPNVAFGDVNYALLVGSRPRSKGMERKDLLEANGAIFTVQGKALSDNAAADVRILVVGNPANTNALIAMNNAPEHPQRALHRHDPPRPQPGHGPAGGQDRHHRQRHHPHDHLGQPLGHPVPRPVPRRGRTARTRPTSSATRPGSTRTFLPTVQQRGAAIIEARGLSSAASAANAAIDHVRTWVSGTARGRLGVDGPAQRRQLRRARGTHVVVPGDLRRRRVHGRRAASTTTTTPGPRSTPRWPSWSRSATPSPSWA